MAACISHFLRKYFVTYFVVSHLTITFSNFVVPTPDIQYDLKCILQPEFYEYAQTKGTIVHEYDIRQVARRLELDRGRIKESLNADYRATFIELD